MNEANDKAHALADGELSDVEAAAVRRELEADEELRREYERAKAVKAGLRRHCQPVANEELWRSCVDRLDEIDGVRREERFVGKYAWALCAIFLVAIFSAAIANRVGASTVSTEAIASALVGIQPGSVEDASPPSIDLPAGLAPLAVGQAESGDALITEMRFADEGGPYTLLVIDGVQRIEGLDSGEGAYLYGRVAGLPCVQWTEGDRALLVVADRTPRGLLALAERLRSAND